MVIALTSLNRVNRAKPPIVLLHSSHGVGKTTLAASAPDPVFICTEDGLWHDVPSFPRSETFDDILAALGALFTEDHNFKTLVVDSLDWMEPLIWKKTCLINKWASIETPGYGRGYVEALSVWREYIEGIAALRDTRGMTVVQIAHTDIKRFDAPDSDPYDRYQIKLNARASALVSEQCDLVGFLNYRVSTVKTDTGFNKKVVRGVGSGMRVLYTEERPAFVAKNRFGMPEAIDLPDVSGNDPALWASIAQYFPTPLKKAA